jgi:hypothetical protein
MNLYSLSNVRSLSPLLDLRFGSKVYDLHNSYDLFKVKIDGTEAKFVLQSKGENDLEKYCYLVFFGIMETNLNEIITQIDEIANYNCLTNFGKGEFAANSRYYTNPCAEYYFMQLGGSPMIDIVCKSAFAMLTNEAWEF